MTLAKGKTFTEYKRKATKNAFITATIQGILLLIALMLVLSYAEYLAPAL